MAYSEHGRDIAVKPVRTRGCMRSEPSLGRILRSILASLSYSLQLMKGIYRESLLQQEIISVGVAHRRPKFQLARKCVVRSVATDCVTLVPSTLSL